MKLKWMLLVIGLSLSDILVGATFKQKIELTVGKAHDQAHRSPESYGFQASLDGSALRVEQKRLSELPSFTITIINRNTNRIVFTAVCTVAEYFIDLVHFSSGEYRLEIESELILLESSLSL